jgi:hypothetical protein
MLEFSAPNLYRVFQQLAFWKRHYQIRRAACRVCNKARPQRAAAEQQQMRPLHTMHLAATIGSAAARLAAAAGDQCSRRDTLLVYYAGDFAGCELQAEAGMRRVTGLNNPTAAAAAAPCLWQAICKVAGSTNASNDTETMK